MTNFYCKHCGVSKSTVSSLTSNSCNKNPDGNRHELYEGSEKEDYTCKYCGVKKSSISSLVSNSCNKNPNGNRHSPAL